MRLLYITCKDKKEARNIATVLMNKKLIACANIFPINSLYNWKGKMQDEKEVVLLAKTKDSKSNSAEKEIKRLHSYEIPCIIKVNASANKEYQNWINRQLK